MLYWSSVKVTILRLVGTKSPHSGRRECTWPWVHPLEDHSPGRWSRAGHWVLQVPRWRAWDRGLRRQAPPSPGEAGSRARLK